MRTMRPMRCFVGRHRFVYFLRHDSAKRHIFAGGCAPTGGYYPSKFELGRDFCTMHLAPKFHHHMFTRSEVIVLTHKPANKQTPPKTFNVLRYATTLGNYRNFLHPYQLCSISLCMFHYCIVAWQLFVAQMYITRLKVRL